MFAVPPPHQYRLREGEQAVSWGERGIRILSRNGWAAVGDISSEVKQRIEQET